MEYFLRSFTIRHISSIYDTSCVVQEVFNVRRHRLSSALIHQFHPHLILVLRLGFYIHHLSKVPCVSTSTYSDFPTPFIHPLLPPHAIYFYFRSAAPSSSHHRSLSHQFSSFCFNYFSSNTCDILLFAICYCFLFTTSHNICLSSFLLRHLDVTNIYLDLHFIFLSFPLFSCRFHSVSPSLYNNPCPSKV